LIITQPRNGCWAYGEVHTLRISASLSPRSPCRQVRENSEQCSPMTFIGRLFEWMVNQTNTDCNCSIVAYQWGGWHWNDSEHLRINCSPQEMSK
jgi:hypothetical protein